MEFTWNLYIFLYLTLTVVYMPNGQIYLPLTGVCSVDTLNTTGDLCDNRCHHLPCVAEHSSLVAS